jgi:hypothetical protein
MQILKQEELNQVSGGINGYHLTLNINVPIQDAPALEELLADLLLNQLDIPTFVKALNDNAESFDDMSIVGVVITKY